MGYAKKTTHRNPGSQMRRKKGEYALQLQKVKFVYGMEKQFRSYYEKATRMEGRPGENLLILVERRLDNVVYRLGFATTRRDARQLVTHGHFTADIPSYLVKVGDVIEVKASSRSSVEPKLTGEDAPLVTVAPVAGAREERAEGHCGSKCPSARILTCPWKSTSSWSCTPSNAGSLAGTITHCKRRIADD